ncbi:penicillin-binding transpeptidase domain-containing protein [Pseudonocardia endophytica]|uniref:Cell division protein FtsI/penicillin-binding protein 2 n=1 Tax=Pseudonocardia endophytica TaxID=401976 RepID=A0A4R1I5Q2_PSEEN|nr:penicillin-binding transpeptidase domain-containing protein [Pseudonocardia endophytica]TCK25392.1 cell division protein FtsI/penicillin-binding protein 2 [Pseudonocardia endophytica]
MRSPLSSLTARPAVLAVAVVVMLAAGLVVALVRPWDGAADTAKRFSTAWTTGDSAGAAALTSDRAAAATFLDRARQDLKPVGVRATVADVRTEGDRATADVDVDWDLGENRHWTYRTSWPMSPADDTTSNDTGWAIDFSPAILDPRLGAGQRPVLRTTRSNPAPVLDDTGAPLLAPSRTVTVTLDPKAPGALDATAGTLASALGPIDPQITQTSIADGARTTPAGQAYTVAVLREDDYQRVRDRIYDLQGVRFTDDTRLLAPDPDFAPQVLSAVRTEVEGQTDGTPGWTVDAVGQDGATVASLAGVPPGPGKPVTLGMDQQVQQAAENAVRGQGRQTAIVAIRPSTGAVLGVAQNDAANAAGPIALSGRYPPGSTFKMITAYAAMARNGITPDTPEDCPGTTVINGRTIPNEDSFALGTVPLLQAFAKSCNTTFSRLALGLPPDALPDAASKLGFGADYKIPGLTTVTGSIEPATDDLQRASDGFGQGDVLASPFGMALVAATIAKGAPVTPTLITDRPTETTKAPGTPDQAILDKLRPMMRAVVTQGTATAAAGQGDVFGKTGTAEFAGPGGENRAHGWFVGYRGDMAFAVLIVDGGSSGPAVQLASSFLGGAPR